MKMVIQEVDKLSSHIKIYQHICAYFSPDSDKFVRFEVTNISFLQTCNFSLHKMLIDGLESCGLLVDKCVFFCCFFNQLFGLSF